MTGVSIRRARPDDADYLLALVGLDDVRPFLGPRTAADRDATLVEIARSEQDPRRFGRYVIEVDGERAGAVGFHVSNEPSRIARLERLAVHPDFRGRRVADEAARLMLEELLGELGYHRLEVEIYEFNTRAQAHAERIGFVREGVKRKAYLRDGVWHDTAFYAVLRDDLDGGEPD